MKTASGGRLREKWKVLSAMECANIRKGKVKVVGEKRR